MNICANENLCGKKISGVFSTFNEVGFLLAANQCQWTDPRASDTFPSYSDDRHYRRNDTEKMGSSPCLDFSVL